jgi:hypothetical protein
MNARHAIALTALQQALLEIHAPLVNCNVGTGHVDSCLPGRPGTWRIKPALEGRCHDA